MGSPQAVLIVIFFIAGTYVGEQFAPPVINEPKEINWLWMIGSHMALLSFIGLALWHAKATGTFFKLSTAGIVVGSILAYVAGFAVLYFI